GGRRDPGDATGSAHAASGDLCASRRGGARTSRQHDGPACLAGLHRRIHDRVRDSCARHHPLLGGAAIRDCRRRPRRLPGVRDRSRVPRRRPVRALHGELPRPRGGGGRGRWRTV
ncbi:MAG: hypothetical protein AVDCRST_MAG79-2700, partial [uncultured Thermoleophilia bacterium]